jgi:hypothetical protein
MLSDERPVLAFGGELTAVLDEEVCLAHPAQLARRPFINRGGRLCGRGGPDRTVGLWTGHAQGVVGHRRPVGADDCGGCGGSNNRGGGSSTRGSLDKGKPIVRWKNEALNKLRHRPLM